MNKTNYILTSAERNFLTHWKDQKSGPKWQFYGLYSLAWSVVSFLVIFFFTKLFTNLWETGGPNLIYGIIIIAIISGVVSTHYMYVSNERKYQRIILKVKQQNN